MKGWFSSAPRGWLAAAGAVALWGCAGGGSSEPVEEATYFDGMETNAAVEEEAPNGGYRTVAGTPVVMVNGEVEPESLLPYGGGEEGIRQAEDETPFPRLGL